MQLFRPFLNLGRDALALWRHRKSDDPLDAWFRSHTQQQGIHRIVTLLFMAAAAYTFFEMIGVILAASFSDADWRLMRHGSFERTWFYLFLIALCLVHPLHVGMRARSALLTAPWEDWVSTPRSMDEYWQVARHQLCWGMSLVLLATISWGLIPTALFIRQYPKMDLETFPLFHWVLFHLLITAILLIIPTNYLMGIRYRGLAIAVTLRPHRWKAMPVTFLLFVYSAGGFFLRFMIIIWGILLLDRTGLQIKDEATGAILLISIFFFMEFGVLAWRCWRCHRLDAAMPKHLADYLREKKNLDPIT